MSVESSRRSNSSVRVYWNNGRALGCPLTSVISSVNRPCSNVTPTRRAGPSAAASSSSAASGVTLNTLPGHQAAERRVHQRAVVEVRPQGDQHPGAAPRVRGQGDEAVEEAVALLVVDQREQLFELVDHQQQP